MTGANGKANRKDIPLASRALLATVLVAALVAAPPVLAAIVAAVGTDGPARVEPAADLDYMPAANPDALLSGLEEAAGEDEGPLPDYFAEEAALPSGARAVRVDDSGTVVGCTVDTDAKSAAAELQDALAAKGWTCVPLGDAAGATYLKEGGACRWMIVTFVEMGPSTSLVYRCAVEGA